MKIEKLDTGSVLIKDENDAILHILPLGLFVKAHPSNLNAVLISKTMSNAHENESLTVYVDNVSSINGTAFNGTRSELLTAFTEVFNIGATGTAPEAPAEVPAVHSIDFSGRYSLHNDYRWVGLDLAYGIAAYKHERNNGIGSVPAVNWDSLGIGFLPAGAKLLKIELAGNTTGTDVVDLEVHLSKQGANFDTTGFNSTASAANVEILPATSLDQGIAFNKFQKWEIDLGGHVLAADRIIDFNVRPVAPIGGLRYLSVNAKLFYEI